MELLYRVKPDLLPKGGEEYLSGPKRMKLLPKRGPIVAVSPKNLIAFSSNIDLLNSKKISAAGGNASNGSTSGTGLSGLSSSTGAGSNASINLNSSPWTSPFATPTTDISGAHVYIADLNTPWEYNFIKNSSAQISHMQWDHAGSRLLIGTEDGQVEVYGMTDNLLNKWHVVYSGSFPGEPILSSCWLGMPRKVQVVVDKVDSLIYSEKYHSSVLSNSRGFGGKSLDGCVVITATGLVGGLAHFPHEEPLKAITAKEKISAVRNLVVCADMTYSKNGDIVVVSGGGWLKHPILVNRVELNLLGTRDKAQVIVTPSQSLFLPPTFSDYSVSSLKFINKTNSDSLLISLMDHSAVSTIVCLYELTQESLQLKPRFQTSHPEKLVNYKWNLTSQLQFPAAVLDTCSLPINLTTTAYACNSSISTNSAILLQNHMQNLNAQTNSVLTPLIALSLSNGTVVLSRSDNLHQIATINCSSNSGTSSANFLLKRERDEFEDVKPGSKAMSLSSTNSADEKETYVSMQFTWSGSLLIALTANCNLSVYKMHPNIDASNATMLIELSMIGGLDPWDVMMCLRQNQIESITDRLSETFARQPPAVQTHYNARILVIKSAIYRLACGGTARTNDQTTLLTLHLVSGALKALLRPGDLSSLDKGPAESLSSLLSSKGEQLSDVDKVLVHLVPKEYTVEPSTLQSLQQFLQWCADLALKLLTTLPDLRHSRAPLWEVCRDSRAISTLRELIVLMRIWGLIRPSCLPAFRKTSESTDVLPQLFRLLTRLSVAPHDPDESLIDEYLINSVNPQEQHKFADVDATTYYILGFVLIFGLVVLALLGLAMWLDCRRKQAEEGLQRSHSHQGKAQTGKSYNDNPKGQAGNHHHLYGHTHSGDLGNRNLYPNPEVEEKESLFDGSMVTTTTTEIQPKAPPLSCEKIDEMSRKSSAFGMLNIHQQQRQSNASSSTDFGMHNSVSNQQFPIHPPSSSSTTNVSSNISLAGNSKRGVSKMESFPYEEYGIPEDERQPIKTRVQDLKTYDHFLRLTRVDSELLREDSIDDDRSSGNDDDGRVGRFESQATLPRDSFDRPAN